MVVPNTEAGCFWMYEQRLLELPSVWIGINTLWAFELSLSKFFLVWFLPSISCFSTSVDCKIDLFFFQQVYFSACQPWAHCFCQLHPGCSSSWASAQPVGGEVVTQAPLLSSWILRKVEKLCVFHSTLVKSPRGVSILPPVDCSSQKLTQIWQCTTADVLWMCFLLGGLCSSWGQDFQTIAELWAPKAKAYWFFLCSGIFGTSMHAGVQLEGLKIKRTG